MSEVKNKFNELSDEVLDDVAGGANGLLGHSGTGQAMQSTGHFQNSTGNKGLTSTGNKGLTSTGNKGLTSTGYYQNSTGYLGQTSTGNKGHGLNGLLGHKGKPGKGKSIKDKNDGTNKTLK